MSDKNRFKKRRAVLRARGLCVRCGHEKPPAGHVKCKKCALEIGMKKIVAPPEKIRCEKIGRLRGTLALIREAEKAVLDKLAAIGG